MASAEVSIYLDPTTGVFQIFPTGDGAIIATYPDGTILAEKGYRIYTGWKETKQGFLVALAEKE